MKIMKFKLKVMLFLVLLGMPSLVFAFSASLLNDTITLPSAQQVNLQIKNSEKKIIAVEINLKKRKYSIDNVEDYSQDTDQLLAIPSQIILNPGEEQVVAIRWVGPETLEKEQPFRVVAENIPIDTTATPDIVVKSGKSTASISLAYRLVKGLYVQPAGGVHEVIEVLDLKEAMTTDNHKLLLLKIANTGTAHKIIRKMVGTVLFVNSKNESQELSYPIVIEGKDLENGMNFLCDEVRKVTVKVPTDWVLPKDYKPKSMKVDYVVENN